MIHSRTVLFRSWVWKLLSTTILPAQRALFLCVGSLYAIIFGVSRLNPNVKAMSTLMKPVIKVCECG